MPVFGQLVTGPPGAGKTTYCHGMHQFLTALDRPVAIVNLDPAVSDPPYPCALNLSTDLISLEEIQEEHSLGPNGAMLYAMEYLEANMDWLEQGLQEIVKDQEEELRGPAYIIFDTPGQVELWTNHDSLKRIIYKLTKQDYRLVVVHLSDAHYVTDASKFISVLLLALRAMLQLELPHVNVLSKMDLIAQYGQLPFNLEYYTEVQDLEYLAGSLDKETAGGKYAKLNHVICQLVEEYGLVGFETLAVEDKKSMLTLLKLLDKAIGYAYIPPAPSSTDPTASIQALTDSEQADHEHQGPPDQALTNAISSLTDKSSVMDVQERWIDNREAWDEYERVAKERLRKQMAAAGQS